MLKFEIVVWEESATAEDVDDLMMKLEHQVKYADGMGEFSIGLIEDDVDA